MNSRATLNKYQKIVTIGEVPIDDYADILHAILEYLKLEIIKEATPDYVLYEVREVEPAP